MLLLCPPQLPSFWSLHPISACLCCWLSTQHWLVVSRNQGHFLHSSIPISSFETYRSFLVTILVHVRKQVYNISSVSGAGNNNSCETAPLPLSGCTQLPGEKYWLSQFRKEFYIGKVQLHVPSTTSIAICCWCDPQVVHSCRCFRMPWVFSFPLQF